MKKILLTSIIIAAIAISCKKDRECTCTYTQTKIDNPTSQNGNTTTTEVITTTQTLKAEHVTKKGAEAGICASGEVTTVDNTNATVTYSGITQTEARNGTSTTTKSCKLD